MLKLRTLSLVLVAVALAAVVCGTPAEASPRLTVRSDNAVVLRGIALADVRIEPSPYGSQAVNLAVEGYPLDGPVLVLCDATAACDRVRRGDRLLVKGDLRIDPQGGKAYVVASSLTLKESGR